MRVYCLEIVFGCLPMHEWEGGERLQALFSDLWVLDAFISDELCDDRISPYNTSWMQLSEESLQKWHPKAIEDLTIISHAL